MVNRYIACVVTGLSALLAVGCSSASTVGDQGADALGTDNTPQGDVVPGDSVEPGSEVFAEPDTAIWRPSVEDAQSPVVMDTGVGVLDAESTTTDAEPSEDVEPVLCPGCFGAPCEDNEDCNSGWCIDGPDGAICTKTCSADCPSLFSCKPVGAGGDPVYICIYDHLQACRPCGGPVDCVHPVTGDTAECVSGQEGAEGAFCATPCSDDGACPDGMTCDTTDDASVCMPASGVCACSAAAIAEGASTACWQTNDAGTCDGARMCTADGLSDCDAAIPVEELCNEADDDCDGLLDEGFEQVGTPCDGDDDDQCQDGLWACTADGLQCGDDEDSVVEVCDDQDNDCDGLFDEDFEALGTACDGNDEDLCADGQWVCEAQGLTCDDDEAPLVDECNGLDDDCDGSVDEGFVELGEPCDGEDADLCANGVFVCAADAAGVACAEEGEGFEELCNAADDDCDGALDEGIEEKDTPCDGLDDDQCLDGVWVCTVDGLQCDDDEAGVAEVCDDLDNDCDGGVDEDFEAKGTACDGNDEDLCLDGTWVCEAQGLVCDDDEAAMVDICNSVDDDCDGATDEGFPELGAACDGDDSDLCTNGVLVCAGDGLALTCLELGDGIVELCNGEDDDCDGVVPADESDSDEDGVRICGGDCNDLTEAIKPGAPELCNEVDDDCDSETDEDYKAGGEYTLTDLNGTEDLVLGDPCGVGTCIGGTVVCGAGGDALACTSHDVAQVEACNAGDDDCDGEVDETFAPGGIHTYLDVTGVGVALGETCGVGACAGGEAICTEDGLTMTCSTLGEADAEVCNAEDDDCDGVTDEGTTLINDVSALTAAGCKVAGVCGQPGATMATCTGGNYACQYNAPGYQDTESFCDSADNDCDGLVDEELSWDEDGDGHYTPGSCALPADDCDDDNEFVHPAYPETCDGFDNNCDDVVDPPGSAQCTTYYVDADGDTFGTGVPSCRCESSGDWTATQPGDCYDGNAAAKQGQTEYFSSDRGDGSFDYDCNTLEEKEAPTYASGTCGFFSDVCSASAGWSGGAPGCGNTGVWVSNCHYELKWPLTDSGCYWGSSEGRTVRCR